MKNKHLFTVTAFGFLIGCGSSDDNVTLAPTIPSVAAPVTLTALLKVQKF